MPFKFFVVPISDDGRADRKIIDFSGGGAYGLLNRVAQQRRVAGLRNRNRYSDGFPSPLQSLRGGG